MNIFPKRKLPTIDLWNYFADVLSSVEKGYDPMSPFCFEIRESKKDYTAAEWEAMEKNYRVAEELYKYALNKYRDINGISKNRNADLVAVCENLLDYRDRNTLNFQLEKADDYLNAIRSIIRTGQHTS